jgi:hypothetical protein
MLRRVLEGKPAAGPAVTVAQSAPVPASASGPAEVPVPHEQPRPKRERDRGRGRDRGRRGQDREDRSERREKREARPEPRKERTTPPPPAPEVPIADDREFWEAWVDERQKVATTPGIAPAAAENGADEASHKEAPPLEPGMVRLYLNLGRRDRMRPPDVQSLVAERTGRSDLRIQVRNTHSYISVPEAEAPRIIAALHGTKAGDRELVCELAKKS